MSAYSDRVLLDGAAFYWRLGESAGTTAIDQKGILNGTHLGAVSIAQPGALGGSGDTDKSVSYAATGRTEVAADPRHQSFSNWTLELWAYPTGGGYLAIAGHGYVGAGYMPYVIGLDQTTGYIPTAGFFNGSSWQRVQDSVQVTLNTWVHLVATFDGTTIRLYRNGVLVASGPGTGWTAAPAAAPFRIGERWDEGQFFPGRVDEVSLYPTALTPTQILAHYTAGTTSAGPPQTVQVPGVFPPGYQVSIVGQVIVSDGHLVGWKSGALFGTPTILGAAPATTVGGVPSAQQFGAVTTRIGTPASVTVGGVPSAQQFGALTFVFPPQVKPVGGVPSAQQFGQVKANQRQQVGAVPSAAAFGTPKVAQRYELTGLGTAQQFGAVKALPGPVFRQVQGVPSAQLFGHVTPHRYDLHVTCKPEGGLTMPPSTTGGFVLTPVTTGTFTLTPNVDSPFVLTPIEEGDFVLAAVDEDG